jgi:hypothetical protein
MLKEYMGFDTDVFKRGMAVWVAFIDEEEAQIRHYNAIVRRAQSEFLEVVDVYGEVKTIYASSVSDGEVVIGILTDGTGAKKRAIEMFRKWAKENFLTKHHIDKAVEKLDKEVN